MIDSFTITTKGCEKWFSGYIEGDQLYLDVSLSTAEDAAGIQFRGKVFLDYPCGIILTESQAQRLQVDMTHFFFTQSNNKEEIKIARNGFTPFFCSIPIYCDRNPTVGVEFKKKLYNIEIRSDVQDQNPNEVILGWKCLERLRLTCITKNPSKPLQGYYHPKQIEDSLPVIKGRIKPEDMKQNYFE